MPMSGLTACSMENFTLVLPCKVWRALIRPRLLMGVDGGVMGRGTERSCLRERQHVNGPLILLFLACLPGPIPGQTGRGMYDVLFRLSRSIATSTWGISQSRVLSCKPNRFFSRKGGAP